MEARLFRRSELLLLGRAFDIAEECVSEHFQLTGAGWRRFPYEVRTLADLGPGEVSPKVLAQVLRLRKPARSGRLRHRDFYRICLQDHNLTRAVCREGENDVFLPLLTYVAAHELVHVVRFYQFEHLYQATPKQKSREETKVHGITAGILGKVRLSHLDRVLDLFTDSGGDDYADMRISS